MTALQLNKGCTGKAKDCRLGMDHLPNGQECCLGCGACNSIAE